MISRLLDIVMTMWARVRKPSPEILLAQVRRDIVGSARIPRAISAAITARIDARDFTLRIEKGGTGKKGVCRPSTGEITLWVPTKVVLFHELVHLIGGNEWDAEVYEYLMYGRLASLPDPTYDFRKFIDSEYRGKFARYFKGRIYSESGLLLDWRKTKTFLARLPNVETN